MTQKVKPSQDPSAHLQLLCFQLSLTCNAACRACAYDCHPSRGPVIPEEKVNEILEQAEDIEMNRTIAFTGGEPFLHYNLLKRLSTRVKDRLGYDLTVSTNCFWAATPERARRIVGEMSELGLAYLLVSVDDFHQEYIDLERVENGVQAAVDQGVRCVLQGMETRSSRKMDWYREHMDIPSDPELIQWNPTPSDPVGRAAKDIPADDLLLNWRKQAGCCSMLRAFIVNADGAVSNCCGSANGGLPHIGNAFEEPMADIFKRVNADPLLNALAAWGGPSLLMDILRERGFTEYAERSYTSPCHACHSIFHDPRAMEIVQNQLALRRAELVATRLFAQKQHMNWKLGGEKEELYVLGTWLDDPAQSAARSAA